MQRGALVRRPLFRVRVAAELVIKLQHRALKALIVPPCADRVRQKAEAVVALDPRIAPVEHAGEHAAADGLRAVLLQHRKRRGEP